MELTVQIPFQQFISAIKTLTLAQKAVLRKELAKDEQPTDEEKALYLEKLLNGPTLTDTEIGTIHENRNSIAKWRTKS